MSAESDRTHAKAAGRERPDWLYGTGATRREKGAVWLTVVVAIPVIVAGHQRAGAEWHWWHWLLVVGLAADLVGGVVANSLAPAKRLYHQPLADGHSRAEWILRNRLAFTALHVHPFLVAALFPGAGWAWAAGWYAAVLLGVGLVLAMPLQLKRPAGMGTAALAALAAGAADGPAGMDWLGPVLVLKLVVAHAVPEGAPADQPKSGR